MQRKPLRDDQTGQLDNAQNILIGLVIIAIIGGVGGLTLDSFQDDIAECPSGLTYNTSSNECSNSTTTTNPNGTAFNTTSNALEGLNNMSSQFGTVGTIGIASVLLSLVLGAFAFGRSRR